MKFKIQSTLQVHVCFQEQGGCEVIAFDLYHNWRLPECRNLDGENMVLRMESNRLAEDDLDNWDMVGFSLRYLCGMKKVKLGTGKRALRVPFLSQGSGGNIYWDVIVFPLARLPHVLNWLRRQRNFSKSEWQENFMPLWQSRRALDAVALRRWMMAEIRHDLKCQANVLSCTVEQLIEKARIK